MAWYLAAAFIYYYYYYYIIFARTISMTDTLKSSGRDEKSKKKKKMSPKRSLHTWPAKFSLSTSHAVCQCVCVCVYERVGPSSRVQCPKIKYHLVLSVTFYFLSCKRPAPRFRWEKKLPKIFMVTKNFCKFLQSSPHTSKPGTALQRRVQSFEIHWLMQ